MMRMHDWQISLHKKGKTEKKNKTMEGWEPQRFSSQLFFALLDTQWEAIECRPFQQSEHYITGTVIDLSIQELASHKSEVDPS